MHTPHSLQFVTHTHSRITKANGLIWVTCRKQTQVKDLRHIVSLQSWFEKIQEENEEMWSEKKEASEKMLLQAGYHDNQIGAPLGHHRSSLVWIKRSWHVYEATSATHWALTDQIHLSSKVAGAGNWTLGLPVPTLGISLNPQAAHLWHLL